VGGDGPDLAVVVGRELRRGGWPVGFVAAVGPQPEHPTRVGSPKAEGVLLGQQGLADPAQPPQLGDRRASPPDR
jgi:hypothetical protein